MMSWRKGFSGLGILLLVAGIFTYGWAAAEKQIPKVGPVKLNLHPASLEGQTVEEKGTSYIPPVKEKII